MLRKTLLKILALPNSKVAKNKVVLTTVNLILPITRIPMVYASKSPLKQRQKALADNIGFILWEK